MATHAEIRQQQHQTQHGAGDEGQGKLRDEFPERLKDEELDEALDHVDSLVSR